ncbi:MAG TPA: lamin tail domain-containing protein [Verrucomicrobiae bacterium]|nr:lamin tail domain-containing protein [Verrucomicrobiae bacterium]
MSCSKNLCPPPAKFNFGCCALLLFIASFTQGASVRDVPGPSSRTTPLAISEIMYKPASRPDGKNVEFVELYNSNPWFQDISGYTLTCANMSYTFPKGTLLASNSYTVIAAVPADVQTVYGITNVLGPYSGSLKKSETLQLLDEVNNVLLTVPYSNVFPWPVAATGTGHSIVLANPTYGEGDPRAWDISDVIGGSPGQFDVLTPGPLRSIVINEIMSHSENPAVPQFIELYNHSTNTVDISGCILTDDPATNKFIIPAGTVIGPAGFVSFTQPQLGFTLNGGGGTLYFFQADRSRILDAIQFNAQADGVSYGRWPDGANDFYAFSSITPGTNNSAIFIGDIVINELMYDPISGNDDDQYVELYNQGTNVVNLSGWQFTSGITFTFPTNTTLSPGGYLVVARNQTNLFAKYPNLNNANTVGNYTGKLSHSGELVALAKPEVFNGTNAIFVEADEVTYGTGGRWGEWSGGGGSSLELVDPHANHRLAANWADSDESQKSIWTNIETTGVLDNGANFDPSIDYAQIGILDVGECLVDNLEVDDTNGVNYVLNPDFEDGALDNWSLQGDHVRSSLESPGYGSAYALHLRSSDRIWTGDNSCQMALGTNSLAGGQTATLRFKGRWLHGWPEVLLRLNGNWLEATGPLPVPNNLGSPGMPNSAYLTNAGPAVYNVTHNPPLPVTWQPVVVTANVSDPDGVQAVTLYYRLDPDMNYTAVPMTDDGTGGDAIAGDGIFSATIPGQTGGTIAAFYVSATDNNLATTRFPALLADNSPVRECLVMFGETDLAGSFGTYHLWLTQTNAARWSGLGDLSNEGNDCTFVNGGRVIYNMQGRFAGSPYHQIFDTPSGALCHYKWIFGDDDKFLGATSFNKIHQPGNAPGDDASLQREQLANTLLRALGVPWLNRRYVAVYVNGNRRGTLMEDAQVPDGDFAKEHYPNDAGGFLYKMQPWFEFAPQLSGYVMNLDNDSWCTLNDYTTTGGVKKAARYRYNFEIRRTPDSANDFTNVFSLVDAANSYGTADYVANMESMADMENWMRVFAANHAAGNPDSFGAQSGQNLYGYMGVLGTKYSLLMWDFNIVFGSQYGWAPGANLFNVDPSDAPLSQVYGEPTFQRMYWRALEELVNGPLNVTNSGPLLDAKYNAFTANGLAVEDPNTNIKPWLTAAQSSIASQLAMVDVTNFTVDSGVTLSNGMAYVTGIAPVNAATIAINGQAYPLTWTSLTAWSIVFPATNITISLSVVGLDRYGHAIMNESNNVNPIYNSDVSPPGFVNYSRQGSVYAQNFDSLPMPALGSVNADNPVIINGITYSLSDPFGFDFPVTAAGGMGFSGLTGWYGSGALASKFGATDGDQTTGGQISFGQAGSSNRALGLLATSSTGATAFGVKFINGTPATLSQINLQFTGEVWRQSNKSKTLQFYYFIDPAGNNTVFPTNATAFLSGLNVNFPTVSADSGGVAVNGTLPLNQTNLSVTNQTIANWPPGAALWLVWQMTSSTGTSQGLGIDNLSFSANIAPPPLNQISVTVSGTNLFLNWLGVSGQTYQLEYIDDLAGSTWTSLGDPVTGTGGTMTVYYDFGASTQRFFRLRLVSN